MTGHTANGTKVNGMAITFKVQDMRDAIDALGAQVDAVREARENKSADLTEEQKAFQRARSAETFARNLSREGLSVDVAEALDALVSSLSGWTTNAPESMHAPDTSFDRTEGDDLAETLSMMVTLCKKNKAPNVNAETVQAGIDALDAWVNTRPRRGRGSNGGASAGTGKSLPGKTLLTFNGEKVAEEASTVSSLAFAALKAWRKGHGIDENASENKAHRDDRDFMDGRKQAFQAIDKGADSASWTDTADNAYRLERV